MNNKIYLGLTLLLLLLGGCRKPLETTAKEITQKELSGCQEVSCPEITIEYLKVNGKTEASEKINTEIEDFVIQSLYVGEDESGSTAPTIEKAMEDFIALYRTHSAEFPGLSAEYFAEITVLESFNNKELLSVSCRNYLYTGGAHGYGMVVFENFDPKSGALLGYEDVFQDVSTFSEIAETHFRKDHDIPQQNSINATGFWFEDDTFYLPETFGISKEFVTLQYNQYEIAPYAAGPIVLEIPISKIEDLLKVSLK